MARGLPRHSTADAYIIEELRSEYQFSDPKGRIRLLKKLYKDELAPPYEIAVLAVEDEDVEVRRWIARHGKYLDYRNAHEQPTDKDHELNLAERLKEDSDPFVRACLRENPAVFGDYIFHWEEYFKEATHLERLALVRNPRWLFSDHLMEAIFDLDANKLSINFEERRELALAYLTNTEVLHKQASFAGIHGYGSPSYDGSIFAGALRFFDTIWTLASKWPVECEVPYSVFRYVPCFDDTKAETYAALDEPFLRRAILENCTGEDKKTLKLALKDTEGKLRWLAYSKVSYLEPAEIEALLAGNDVDALWGLYYNESLDLASMLDWRERNLSKWYSISLGRMQKMGTGEWCNWYYNQDQRTELARVLNRDGGSEFLIKSIMKMIFNRPKYLEEGRGKSYWNNRILVELRECIMKRLEELGQRPERERSHFVEKQLAKLPPTSREELFDFNKSGREGNFLEWQMDFIGQRLLFFEDITYSTSWWIRSLVIMSVIGIILLLIGMVLLLIHMLE